MPESLNGDVSLIQVQPNFSIGLVQGSAGRRRRAITSALERRADVGFFCSKFRCLQFIFVLISIISWCYGASLHIAFRLNQTGDTP
ncbi:Uncharacterised protein [Chromobacterium violaceum]|uniref:Uncharacterized protein n=1 Tax=Chromobacterium violaceum TaxID=536 RepID=A0A3S4HLJ9_CHRVL|nr:Uncharacterised protein [Chromobacterium violaceum]